MTFGAPILGSGKPAVYLETSVISYAVARPSRDLVRAERQRLTREWFLRRSRTYELYVSQLVLDEAAGGHAGQAQARMKRLRGIPVLRVTEVAVSLSAQLVALGAVPRQAAVDAVHVAVAAVHGVDFLLTWNCRHIANEKRRYAIEAACRSAGFEPPVICTPEELRDGQEG